MLVAHPKLPALRVAVNLVADADVVVLDGGRTWKPPASEHSKRDLELVLLGVLSRQVAPALSYSRWATSPSAEYHSNDMLVTLDQSLFRAVNRSEAELIALLSHGSTERHVFVCDPPFDAEANDAVNSWIRQCPTALQLEIGFVLDLGNQLRPTLPAGTSAIRVVDAKVSNWPAAVLTLSEARRLLDAPVRILLENRNADLKFLLRLAPTVYRRRLEDLMAHGWVEPEQGGGISEIRVRLTQLSNAGDADISARIQRLKLFVLFDRDSSSHDRTQPSADSNWIVNHCMNHLPGSDPWKIRAIQLGRRTIESYIPQRVLEIWAAEANQARRRERVYALTQLRRTRPNAAWQYNMKNGLIGDLGQKRRNEVNRAFARVQLHQARPDQLATQVLDGDLDPLFQGLGDHLRGALAVGFGTDIARVYENDWSEWEPDFREEYALGPATQPSREAIFDQLFELI
jgi:hypothetical protein